MPVSQTHLLLVEDDRGIGAGLTRALDSSGYRTTWVTTAREALAITEQPALVLLDLGLPDSDGLEVARRLRARWDSLPVMMVTARTEEMDIVVGLDGGAVDYIGKPFRLAELLARVRAQLRDRPGYEDPDDLVDGNIRVDVGARRLYVSGEETDVRTKEFDLLVELLTHRGRVVTREDLMARVWDEHWFGSTKTLDVHVSSLRRRLGEKPGSVSRITSLRGVGYRWDSVETHP